MGLTNVHSRARGGVCLLGTFAADPTTHPTEQTAENPSGPRLWSPTEACLCPLHSTAAPKWEAVKSPQLGPIPFLPWPYALLWNRLEQ